MGKCNDIVFELEVEKSESGMESNQENKEKVEKNDKKEEWKDAVDQERNINLGKGKNQEILDEPVDDNYIISEEDLKEIEGEYDEEDLDTADYLDSKGRGEMGSGLGEYLKDIGMYPKLSDEEVLELAKRIKDFGDMEARNKLVSHNLKLVISVAKRYTWSSLSILDLIEEGNLGLMKAAERYDYTKGYKFSTYATWWIRAAIQRGVGDYGRSIRLPMHMLEKVNKVSVVRNNMIKELEREVEPEEIAVRMGMEVLKIKEILGSKEMTAREVAIELFKRGYTTTTDRNSAAPRLTELVDKCEVEIAGKKFDEQTGRNVATYKIIAKQLSMFAV